MLNKLFFILLHTLCCRRALPTFVLNALLPLSRVCLFASVYPLVVDVDRFGEEVYGGLSGGSSRSQSPKFSFRVGP